MVQWIAILVALVCLSGSSFSRSWVGFDDEDIGSWEADSDDEFPGSKFKYHGRAASEESYEDYNEGYGTDAHTLNNQAYHNNRDGHAFGYDHNHDNHHQYHGEHGYTDHWGPHGYNSQSGFSGQSGQYGGSHGHPGFPGRTHAHPDQHWGSYGHHSGPGSSGQHWGSHGHPSQPGSGQASQNSGPRRGLPQNNLIPPQRSSNDPDRVVFPDFNNQVPTTRSPQPTRPVTTSTTTARATTTDRTLLDLVICIRACPTTSEYNPVCGTNNVTYNNPGALQCARNCGLNVGVARQATCPRAVPQIPQATSTARLITNPTTSATSTVSGQTTRATPVPRPTTVRPTTAPTMNPTRFTNIDVNSNRPGPTLIPLDILQSVFGNASPTTNNNEELEFDIDKRINP